ncbi:hypothetical protein [Nocardia sp. NPDC051570]|uniref:hypothetical protein n=1 Tax=Nocardia sp. NPDC051570 TaxID=3364324 RepID=UPI0037B04991
MEKKDLVLLVADGVSTFRVLEIEGDFAWVESAELPDGHPSKYRWRTETKYLVATT